MWTERNSSQHMNSVALSHQSGQMSASVNLAFNPHLGEGFPHIHTCKAAKRRRPGGLVWSGQPLRSLYDPHEKVTNNRRY